jgi:hypothetical protein
LVGLSRRVGVEIAVWAVKAGASTTMAAISVLEPAIRVTGDRFGKLPDGGVSERPKEHASKACDG